MKILDSFSLKYFFNPSEDFFENATKYNVDLRHFTERNDGILSNRRTIIMLWVRSIKIFAVE